jgi:hypothetical protein
MSSIIEDGTGRGYSAKVNSFNRLETRSVTASVQHVASLERSHAYQVKTEMDVTATEQNCLLIQNSSTIRTLIVTFIRVETIGVASANENAYFKIKLGGKYSSGGTSLTPVNVNSGAAQVADGVFYDGNSSAIVTSGTYSDIDKTWKASNDLVTYNKEGAVCLTKDESLLITHKGSTAAGKLIARVSFFYDLLEK